MGSAAWRGVVVLLLLANGVFFAWSRGWLDGIPGLAHDNEREPQRLQHQLRADRVRLAPPPVTAASAVSPALAPSAPTVAMACLEAGPFADHDLAAVQRQLETAGFRTDRWQALAAPASPSWWVYMGRYADADTLARKTEELKRINVRYQLVRSPPPLQPGLLLGRFDDDAAAEAELARLAARGIRTARVVSVTGEPGLQLLRIGAAEPAEAERLAAMNLGETGRAFVRCTVAAAAPGLPASAAAALSAAPASAAASAPASTPTR